MKPALQSLMATPPTSLYAHYNQESSLNASTRFPAVTDNIADMHCSTSGTDIEWKFSLDELLALERQIISNYTWALEQGDHINSDDPLTRPAVRTVVIAVFMLVILVGVAANSVVLCVLVSGRRMKQVTNVFIGNLAVSDLWLCAVSLPVQLHYQMTERWIFGSVLCRIVFAAFAVPMYSSILSILWIAVDRYRLIVCPLRRRWTTGTAHGMIAISVIVSMLISAPVIRYTSVHYIDHEDLNIHKSFCVELWPSTSGRRVYSLVVFIVQFCLPLVVTAALYERIYASLRRRRSARLHGTSSNHRCRQNLPPPTRIDHRHSKLAETTSWSIISCGRCCRRPYTAVRQTNIQHVTSTSNPSNTVDCSAAERSASAVRPNCTSRPSYVAGVSSIAALASRRRRRNGRRTIRLVFGIVANFVAFWLPWNVFSLIVELDRSVVRGSYFRIIDLGLKVFALAGSACVNPFFYCWFNENFRNDFASLVSSVPLGLMGRGEFRPAEGRQQRNVRDGSPEVRREGVANPATPAAPQRILDSDAGDKSKQACYELPARPPCDSGKPTRQSSPVDNGARCTRRQCLEQQHGSSTTMTTGCGIRDSNKSLSVNAVENAETKL